MDINLDQEMVRVLARFEEKGSVRAGDKSGRCLGFEIELTLETPEKDEQVRALLQNAHRMCFTENALTGPVPVSTKHVINGKEFNSG
jgi:organic hydroperoxide reductase OsmC/OhrA